MLKIILSVTRCYCLLFPLLNVCRKGYILKNKVFLLGRACSIFQVFTLLFSLSVCSALESREVAVLANKESSKSILLARFYMEQRMIPMENYIEVGINESEICTREEYLEQVVDPVRTFLFSERGVNIRCLVVMYGIPLKIAPPPHSDSERKAIDKLIRQKERLERRIDEDNGEDSPLLYELNRLKEKIAAFRSTHDKWASLDSELSLVKKEEYDLNFWLANPFYIPHRYRSIPFPLFRDEVMMVSRLDASSPDIVKRMIQESLEVELKGLRGRAYFDARWPEPEASSDLSGYALTDKLIHLAAKGVVKNGGVLSVITDESESLFQPVCTDVALYCGWYSLARYVDAFEWTKGAVGYHIASAECSTLKSINSEVWCKRMLEKGVVATVGPVGEPYVQAFPNSEIFFKFLTEGYLTLVECYYLSLPHLSWKMVLVGDPLYTPFQRYTPYSLLQRGN